MKVNMDLEVRKALVGALQDEQPGSVLGSLRQQVEATLVPKPGQQMTGDELDEVLALVDGAIRNPQWGSQASAQGIDQELLKSVQPKLDLMLERQRDREEAQAMRRAL